MYYRFVKSFTGKMIMFGKVMKEIKCEMTTDLLEQGYKQYVAQKSSRNNAGKAECSFSSSMEDVSVTIVNQHNSIHESTKAEDNQKIDSEARGQLESRRDCDREIKEEVNLISSSSIEDVPVEIVNQGNNSMQESTKAEDDRRKDAEAKGELESTQDGDQETKEKVNLTSSSSLKKNQEKQEKGKKFASERKKKNAAKFNIPGSAKR